MLKSIVRFLSFGFFAADGDENYLLSDPRIKRILGWGNERSTAGITVNDRTALTCSAWWRGLDLLSDAVAKMPYGVYRDLAGDKGKVLDPSHPWHYALSRKAGDYWTAFTFRKLMVFFVAHRGNGYAYIDRENHTLTPINPNDVSPIMTDAGIRYHYAPAGKFYHPDEILHYKGMGFDGLVGYSVLDCAHESLGLSLAARRFQAKSFKNSARPSVILQFPRKMKDDEKKKIREDWERMLQGADNAKSTIVIDGEMSVKDFAFSAAEIQLMETQRFSIVDIANFLGVPAHKLGSKEGEGYNSLEQENLAWNVDKLEALFRNIEQEDEDKLLTEDEKKSGSHLIAFDRTLAAFASADLTAKANYLRTACGGHPWMTPAEARRLDNLNYLEGTDFLPAPANMGGQNNEPKNPAADPPRRKAGTKPDPRQFAGEAAEAFEAERRAPLSDAEVRHLAERLKGTNLIAVDRAILDRVELIEAERRPEVDVEQLRASTAAALETACRRVVRRLGAQAVAAAKRHELAGYAKALRDTVAIATVSNELEHVEAAAGLAHGVDLRGRVAGQILAHLEHRLVKAMSAGDVVEETAAYVARVEAAVEAAVETVKFTGGGVNAAAA